MNEYMVANQNAVIEHDGERVILRAGVQIAHKDHEIVTDHPRLWDPVTIHYDKGSRSTPVESATAAPGERRSITTTTSSSAPTRRGRKITKGSDDK